VSKLIAIDVALLPPPEVANRALAISASLPAEESKGLVLAPDRLPHITLTQHFVREEELEEVLARVERTVSERRALPLEISGSGGGTSSVWMTVEQTPELLDLHHAIMETLRGLERGEGGRDAFVDADARVEDVLWVATFRTKASFGFYTPHITLGHASSLPTVERQSFVANTVAVCRLGHFCTCRSVVRQWTLQA
jgi:hypothetical protein